MLRLFVRDSLIYALPAIVSRGYSILLVPLYTRVLVPADYGVLDLLLLFASAVNLLLALEVTQGLARFYTDETDLEQRTCYSSSALYFTLACYGAFGVTALAFSSQLADWFSGLPRMQSTVRLGVLYICCNGFLYFLQNQLRWELKSRGYAAVSFSVATATALFSVVFAYFLGMRLNGMLLGMILGSVLGIALALYYLRASFGICFRWYLLSEMLFFSVPFVPSGIAVFVSTYIDRIMIKSYLTVDDLGLYGVGMRLAGTIGLVLVGFQSALTPLIYTHFRSPETPGQLARIFRIFAAFSLLMSLGLIIFAEDILELLTTPSFYSASGVVAFLVPALLFSQMYIFAPGIALAKKTHLFVLVTLVVAFANVLLNWLLIPMLGLQGAGLATLISNCLGFALFMVFSQFLYYVPHNWRRLALAVLWVIGIAWVVSIVPVDGLQHLFLNMIVLAITCLVFLSLGLVTSGEMLVARRHLRSRFSAINSGAPS